MYSKEILLTIKKETTTQLRSLYTLMKIDELTSEHYSHLSIAYHEIEKLSIKLYDEIMKNEDK